MPVRPNDVGSTKELSNALNKLRLTLVTLREADPLDPDDLAWVDFRLISLCSRSVRRVEAERGAWVAWVPGAPHGGSFSHPANGSEPGSKGWRDGE